MNILERFKQKKEQIAGMVAHVQTAQHVKRASKLKELKKERVRLEGYKKVREIKAREELNIKNLKQNTPMRNAIRSASIKLKVKSQERKSALSKSNDFFNKTNEKNVFTGGNLGNNVFNNSSKEKNVFTSMSKNDVFNFNKKKKR